MEMILTPQQMKYYAEAQIDIISKQKMEFLDEWVMLHVKQKPRWLPMKLYKRILRQLLIVDMFKKNKYD